MLRKQNLSAKETEDKLRKDLLELRAKSSSVINSFANNKTTSYVNQREPRRSKASEMRNVRKRLTEVDLPETLDMATNRGCVVTHKRRSEMPQHSFSGEGSDKMEGSLV